MGIIDEYVTQAFFPEIWSSGLNFTLMAQELFEF